MSILEMSVSGAVMILAIVVVRALAINRLPKKTFLALWGVTLVRLLVPYSLPSALSVYSLLGRLPSPTKTAPLVSGSPTVPILGVPSPNVGIVPPTSDALNELPAVEPYALIWLAGALACALFFAAMYWKCRREFRESLPIDNRFALDWLEGHQLRRTIRLRQSDRISAPLTYGVFCPVILLPKRTDWGDETTLAYVLTHEYVHVRHFDALTKLALTAAVCVHWFNPAVWVMYVLANRDMELSCDEAVVRAFGEHTKSAYAMTLIRMEETRNGLRPLCNNFSKNAIQERILAIMKSKKTTWLAVVVALALVVGVTTAFATTGQTADSGQDTHSALTDGAILREGSLEQTAVTGTTFFTDDAHEPTQDELLDEYGNFGISFNTAGKMLYQGKLVRWFADFVELEEGALATRYVYRNDEGTEYIHTVRDRIDNGDGSYDPFGPLTGIVPWEAGKRDDFGFLFQGDQSGPVATATGNGDSTGMTFEELFAKYKDFGITYVEADGVSGRGNVYLNGQLVSHFAYAAPNGDVFTFGSAEQGGIRVQTDYDENGKLIGVQEMLPDAIAADEEAQQYLRDESQREFEQTKEQLAPYFAFGLDCQMNLDLDVGSLTMTWNGKPVRRLSDAKRGLFVANSLGDGGLGPDAVDLEAVYDGSGNLTGLKIAAD